MDAQATKKSSPLSFMASPLAQSLAASKEAASLAFYCGLHADAHCGNLSDAEGMIRSLITQLLATTSYTFNLEFIDRKFILLNPVTSKLSVASLKA
jgi:hypothetical protein